MVSRFSKVSITIDLKNKVKYHKDGYFIKLSNNKRQEHVRGNEYLGISVSGIQFYVHQLVFLYHKGYIPKYIDHINRNKLDNRIENLREVTSSENSRNTKVKGKSKYRGVSWSAQKQRWQTRIRIGDKRIWLGLHETEERAAIAYDLAAEYYGVKNYE